MGRVVPVGYYATAVALAGPALALAGVMVLANWVEESIRERSEFRASGDTVTPDYEIDLRDRHPAANRTAHPSS